MFNKVSPTQGHKFLIEAKTVYSIDLGGAYSTRMVTGRQFIEFVTDAPTEMGIHLVYGTSLGHKPHTRRRVIDVSTILVTHEGEDFKDFEDIKVGVCGSILDEAEDALDVMMCGPSVNIPAIVSGVAYAHKFVESVCDSMDDYGASDEHRGYMAEMLCRAELMEKKARLLACLSKKALNLIDRICLGSMFSTDTHDQEVMLANTIAKIEDIEEGAPINFIRV